MPCDLRQIKIFNNTKQDMKYIYIYIYIYHLTVQSRYFTNSQIHGISEKEINSLQIWEICLRERKEITLQTHFFYRSIHRGCFVKKVFLKHSKFRRKMPVLESPFNKVTGFRLATLLKRNSNTVVFL